MDGDLRPRFRRIHGTDAPGWGYSATIPADLGHPQTVAPRTTPPSADVGRRADKDGDHQPKERHTEGKQSSNQQEQPDNDDKENGGKDDA